MHHLDPVPPGIPQDGASGAGLRKSVCICVQNAPNVRCLVEGNTQVHRRASIVVLVGIVALAAPAQGQIVVGDPLNAAKTFSSYCSACHRSASSLAKGVSGSTLASFLRQHYTTGPEMSGAMAAYLVQAGNDPRARQRAGQDAGARDNNKDNRASSSRRQAARTDSATDANARQPSPEAQSQATPGSILAPERQNRRQSRASLRPPEPPARAAPTPPVASPDPSPPIEAAPAVEAAAPAQAEAASPAPQAPPDYWASSP